MKDISYYIKKSGVTNSIYVPWNSSVLQNDQFSLWQIYRLDFPSLKSKPFLFLLNKNYVNCHETTFFFHLKHNDKEHEKKLSHT